MLAAICMWIVPIDCDTCRWMTPEVFNRLGKVGGLSSTNEAERLRSLQALLACPTSSIGTVEAKGYQRCAGEFSDSSS